MNERTAQTLTASDVGSLDELLGTLPGTPTAPPPSPIDCDPCRQFLQPGAAYFRVTLGMGDTPSHVGAPAGRDPTVEEVSELLVCEACEPAVSEPLSALLATLWAMRKPDPRDEAHDALHEWVDGREYVDRQAETERSP